MRPPRSFIGSLCVACPVKSNTGRSLLNTTQGGPEKRECRRVNVQN